MRFHLKEMRLEAQREPDTVGKSSAEKYMAFLKFTISLNQAQLILHNKKPCIADIITLNTHLI